MPAAKPRPHRVSYKGLVLSNSVHMLSDSAFSNLNFCQRDFSENKTCIAEERKGSMQKKSSINSNGRIVGKSIFLKFKSHAWSNTATWKGIYEGSCFLCPTALKVATVQKILSASGCLFILCLSISLLICVSVCLFELFLLRWIHACLLFNLCG